MSVKFSGIPARMGGGLPLAAPMLGTVHIGAAAKGKLMALIHPGLQELIRELTSTSTEIAVERIAVAQPPGGQFLTADENPRKWGSAVRRYLSRFANNRVKL